MRIAFVSANREVLPDPVLPLGLLHVMAAVPAPHEKKLVDLCWEPDPLAAVREALASFAPDLVAVGLRNIQNSDYSGTRDNIDYYERLTSVIRSVTRAPLCLGGGGFSVLAKGLMERLAPDFGIVGEGEEAFAALVRALESGARDFSGIGRLFWRRGGELVENPPKPSFQRLDALPPADRAQVDARYYQNVGIDAVQTKRGCGLSCAYCTYPLIEGRAVRTRPPARVVDELLAAKEQHPRSSHFFIVDSVFNLPAAHAKAICREMIARKLQTPWTCYANPLGFDRELAELMVAAGCAGMEVGTDSGSDEVLARLGKGFATADVLEMSALCREVGLRDCHTFVLGTQGETLEHVRESLAFLTRLAPFAAILMVWTDDDEALDPALAAPRRALRDGIRELLVAARAAHPRWIMPALSVNFDARLFRLLRRRGLTGPLWQHIDMVERPGAGALPQVGFVDAPTHRRVETGPLRRG